jgi:outer membrane receptor protein involved in Fe transport
MKRLQRVLAAGLMAAACAAAVWAQTDVTTTRISGTVSGEDGAALPGATVVIANQETGLTAQSVSDERGFYRLLNLPSGNYTLTATLDGFATATAEVRLVLGSTPTVDFALPLASVSETITVSSDQVALVEVTNTQASTTIRTEDLQELPSAGRDYRNLVLLTPQTLVEPERRSLAISGQRGINTNVTVDGGDFNNPFFGGPVGVNEGRSPLSLSQESIKEMTVITNGASAEFGRSGGGVVSIITKSGTNNLHGSLFYYNQPQSLISDFSNGVAPGDQEKEQYGGSIGGAIIQDKLFYFVSYDEQAKSETIPIDRGLLDADIFARYPALASPPEYVQTQDGNVFFGRLDFQATPTHRFMLRFNRSDYEGVNGTSAATTRAESFNGLENNTTDSLVASWSGQFGTQLLNDFTATQVEDDTPRRGKGTDLTEVRLGNFRYGEESFFPVDSLIDREAFSDVLTFLVGDHVIKGGGEYSDTGVDQVFPSNFRGLYFFNNKADLLAGRWSQYQQQVGLNGLTVFEAGKAEFRQKETALFIQDQWFVNSGLTVSAGLRWERQDNPDDPILNMNDRNPNGSFNLTEEIPDDSGLSPRLGASWSPNEKTAVRFAIGRFWSRTPALLMAQPFTSNGLRGARYSVRPRTDAGGNPIGPPTGIAPGWGADFDPSGIQPVDESLLAGFTGLDVFIMDPDFENPYTDRATLGLEHEVMRATVAGLDFTYAEAKQLQYLKNLNRQLDGTVAANGQRRYSSTRPFPFYGRILDYASGAESEYFGITARINRGMVDNYSYSAQVTYSEDRDNDSNERNFAGIQCEDFLDLDNCWGWSVRDQRWKASMSGVWQTPLWGIGLSGAFRYQTGRPFTATTNRDDNNDGESTTDRPTVGGVHFDRNSFRQPDFYSLDLRVSKEFAVGPGAISVAADCFNCTDASNSFVPVTVWGTGQTPAPAFGKETGVSTNPRTIQLSLRYDF